MSGEAAAVWGCVEGLRGKSVATLGTVQGETRWVGGVQVAGNEGRAARKRRRAVSGGRRGRHRDEDACAVGGAGNCQVGCVMPVQYPGRGHTSRKLEPFLRRKPDYYRADRDEREKVSPSILAECTG